MDIAAAASASATGGKAVVPLPPDYSACIAHLGTIAPKPAKGHKEPTTAQLKTRCETQYKALQQQVLGFLISSDWVIGEAASLGVKLSDAEVKKQLLKIKTAQFPKASEFEAFLAKSGQTVSDLLLRIKAVSMLPQKIEAKVTKANGTVSQAQIADYYRQHRQRYGTPEKRAVEIILTKTEAQATRAKKEVEAGKSFATVAKKVSIDATSKANGGLLPEVTKGEEEKALDTAIFSAKLRTLGGPVETPLGSYLYEVKSITPGVQQAIKTVQAAIRQQLTASQQRKALNKFIKDFRAKWKAKTICRSSYLVPDCRDETEGGRS